MAITYVERVKLASQGLYQQKKGPESPLRRLAFAILLQALRDFFAVQRSGKNNKWEAWQRDAIEWFFSKERAPGSFHWVCDLLEVDPRRIPKLLLSSHNPDDKHQKEWVEKFSQFQIQHSSKN